MPWVGIEPACQWFLVGRAVYTHHRDSLQATDQSMKLVISHGVPRHFYIQEQDKHRSIKEWLTGYQLIINDTDFYIKEANNPAI